MAFDADELQHGGKPIACLAIPAAYPGGFARQRIKKKKTFKAIFVFGCLKAPFHTIELVYSRAIVLLPVPDTPQNVNKKRAADTSTSLLSSLEEASEVALGRTYPQPQQICNLILFCLTFVHLLSLTHIICLDCRFAA